VLLKFTEGKIYRVYTGLAVIIVFHIFAADNEAKEGNEDRSLLLLP